jgi:D-alanyl-D-alanine dipeptidase
MTSKQQRALGFAFFILGASINAGELEGHLVDLAKLPNPPIEEIRCATKYNFTGELLYPFPAAFLHRDAAASLEKVQEYLARSGLGLKVWDGYRGRHDAVRL